MEDGTTQFFTTATATFSGSTEVMFAVSRGFINSGTVNYTGNTFRMQSGNFNNFGNFIMQGDLNLAWERGGPGVPVPVFNNLGLFWKSAGKDVGIVRTNFNNYGTVRVTSGTLSLRASGDHSGQFVVSDDTNLDFDYQRIGVVAVNNLYPGTEFQGNGYVNLLGGGTLNVIASASIRIQNFKMGLDNLDSKLDGPGTFGAHSFDWLTGTIQGNGEVLMQQGDEMVIDTPGTKALLQRRLNNLGKVTWSGGDIRTEQNARIVNDGGVFEIQCGDAIVAPNEQPNPTAKFLVQNGGTLNKVAGGANSFNIPVENDNGNVLGNTQDLKFLKGYKQKQSGASTILDGGTLQVGEIFDHEDGQTFLGGGLLEVIGSLIQSAGIVALDEGQLKTTDGYQIAQPALLTGSGLMEGLVSNGGLIEVGGADAVGQISLTGDYVQSGSIRVEFGNETNDQLSVVGTISVGGALDLNPLSSFYGDTFTIISNDESDPVSGNFDGLPEGAVIPLGGKLFQITYAGGDGNDVVLNLYTHPADDAALTFKNSAVPIAVLANDSASATAIVSIASPPGSGTAAVNGDGSITYSPAAGFLGTDSFSYQVESASGQTGQATVTVEVVPLFEGDADEVVAGVFHDFNGPDVPDDFTATVSWNGGQTEDASVALLGNGWYQVTTGHTFPDNGNHVVSATVSGTGGGPVGLSRSIWAENVAPDLDPAGTFSGDEGSSLSLGPVEFTDPGFKEPGHSDETFTYTIDWGDGSSSSGAVTNASSGPPGPSTGSVLAGHVYDDNGSYAVQITVEDDDGGEATTSTTVTVNNVAPTPSIGGPTTGEEGSALAFTGSATDPGPDDEVAGFSYAWDVTRDGSQFASGSGSSFSFTPDDNGSYVVTLTATDKDGGTGTAQQNVSVTNLPPSGSLGNDGPVYIGTPVTVTFSNATDPSTADLNAGLHYSFGLSLGELASDYDDAGSADSAEFTFAAAGSFTVYGRVLDKDNGASDASTTVSVTQAETTTVVSSSGNPSTYGDEVTFTATVAAVDPGAGVPGGSVEFLIGGVVVATESLASGTATYATSTLDAGNQTVTVNYLGTALFEPSSGSLTQVVEKATTWTDLTSSLNPSVYGQSVTFTAIVSAAAAGSPGGLVEFLDGAAVLGSKTLNSSGQASFSTTDLAVGDHEITALYRGAPNYEPSESSPLTQTVTLISTQVTVTSSLNPSVWGQAVTFTATVAAVAPGTGTPAGNVEFLIDGEVISTASLDEDGAATYSTAGLDVGSHSVTAHYVGAGNYAPGDADGLTQQVELIATQTDVTSSVNPSVFGQAVTFTATVSALAPGTGTPAGSVFFYLDSSYVGSQDLAGGTASLTLDWLNVGGHTVAASYSGNAHYAASDGSVSQAVARAGTATGVSADLSASVWGQWVTFTASVSVLSPGAGTPSGQVEFLDGETVIGSGWLNDNVAVFSTADLEVASHGITAHYLGDDSFADSTSGSGAHTVSKASTETTIESSSNPSVYSDEVTFTAYVAVLLPGAGTPTGVVEFRDGVTLLAAVPLEGGWWASYTTSALAVGDHTVTAEYMGDEHFLISRDSVFQGVAPVETSTWIDYTPGGPYVGDTMTFTVTVTAVRDLPFDGTLSLSLDGVVVAEAQLAGAGTLTYATSGLAAGDHTAMASYSGSAVFLASTSYEVEFTVYEPSGSSFAIMIEDSDGQTSRSGRRPASPGQTVSDAVFQGGVAGWDSAEAAYLGRLVSALVPGQAKAAGSDAYFAAWSGGL